MRLGGLGRGVGDDRPHGAGHGLVQRGGLRGRRIETRGDVAKQATRALLERRVEALECVPQIARQG